MRKQFSLKEGPGRKVWVSLIPPLRETSLDVINEHAKALEQAIPFPCKKGKLELDLVRRGRDRGKWQLSMTICYPKDTSLESVRRFFEGAGFTELAARPQRFRVQT